MSRGKKFFGLLLGIIIVSLPSVLRASIDADMVIYNARILTADSLDPEGFSTAQAAAIYGGKFVVVGTNEQALAVAGPNTKKIDLAGRTVIPGLVETHDHVYDYSNHFFPGGKKPENDGSIRWTNKDEFLSQIRTRMLEKKPGEWFSAAPSGGGGFIKELHGEDMGHKGGITVTIADLDKVAPNGVCSRRTHGWLFLFQPLGSAFHLYIIPPQAACAPQK